MRVLEIVASACKPFSITPRYILPIADMPVVCRAGLFVIFHTYRPIVLRVIYSKTLKLGSRGPSIRAVN